MSRMMSPVFILFVILHIDMNKFDLVSAYKPTGDQPQAIEKLVVFCGMWVVEHPDVVEAIVVRA